MSDVPQISPMEAVRGTLTRMESEFSMALPPQIPVQKFIRTTLTAVQMNPDLLQADRRSLLGSCMKAAQDGLLLDGREAALVIFRTKNGPAAQYMPMVGGLLKKLRNSGELASVSAHCVYENDSFEYQLGDDEKIVHKPLLQGNRGKVVAAYAIGKTKDDAIYREVMTIDELEKVRNVSRARDSGPWTQWYDEMCKKTVLRRLMKRMPSSSDVDQVVEHDNETNDLNAPSKQEPGAPLNRLKAALQIEMPEQSDIPVDMIPDNEKEEVK
jgi:recombination protein RecT